MLIASNLLEMTLVGHNVINNPLVKGKVSIFSKSGRVLIETGKGEESKRAKNDTLFIT